MPILVKDYSWEETEGTLRITVPLKGVPANKADIFTTDEYLKVRWSIFLRFNCVCVLGTIHPETKIVNN